MNLKHLALALISSRQIFSCARQPTAQAEAGDAEDRDEDEDEGGRRGGT